jgi:hypothetical protein
MKTLRGVYYFIPSILILLVIVPLAIYSQPLSATQADGICTEAGLTGGELKFCTVYCEKLDCDSMESEGSATACQKVLDSYRKKTGENPPCFVVECPCYTTGNVEEVVAWFLDTYEDYGYRELYLPACWDVAQITPEDNSYISLEAGAIGFGYKRLAVKFRAGVDTGVPFCWYRMCDHWIQPSFYDELVMEYISMEEVSACQNLLLDICETNGYDIYTSTP